MVTSARKSILISAMAEGVFCCCVQSAISLMKWPIPRAKPPGMAASGSRGMDAVASGSSG